MRTVPAPSTSCGCRRAAISHVALPVFVSSTVAMRCPAPASHIVMRTTSWAWAQARSGGDAVGVVGGMAVGGIVGEGLGVAGVTVGCTLPSRLQALAIDPRIRTSTRVRVRVTPLEPDRPRPASRLMPGTA